MGAVHRVVLEGRAPRLARHYPTAAEWEGEPPAEDAWSALWATLEEHLAELRLRVEDPVQTNEVGRAAALLGGFSLVARSTGLPLRVLELGASAGLNLRFDRFAYEVRGALVGDPALPVRLADAFEGRPPVTVMPEVVERSGCDRRPVDPTTEEGRLTLLSYVWPDQSERVALLRGAIEVARQFPARIDAAPASRWLGTNLAGPPGTATVVFHSIVMQYLERTERETLEDTLGTAADRATTDTPLARLAMEPAGEVTEVRLTLWPGGENRVVARAGYHGRRCAGWRSRPGRREPAHRAPAAATDDRSRPGRPGGHRS